MPEEEISPPPGPLDDDADLGTQDHEGDEQIGEHLRFRVGHNLKFRRLDKYLCGRFSHFSRSRLQKLIKEQGVNVNGRPAKPSHQLRAEDEIDIILPPRELTELVPEPIPLNIIYEDDDIIAVNKQANLIVHPARSFKTGTLVNALVYHCRELSTGTEGFRPGIVHRLDRNTTGVILIAKTDHAHWKLARQFADRETRKTYLAVVHGVPDLTADRIKGAIGVHPKVREKCAVRPDGKEAVTYYEVLESFHGYALLAVRPETGRTHQIRVHMEYIKHPIVADEVYGGKVVYAWQIEDRQSEAADPLMGRVALHAWKIRFRHPTSGETLELEAPMPDDMSRFLDHLRQFRPA